MTEGPREDAIGGVLCSQDKLSGSLPGCVPVPSKTRAGASSTRAVGPHGCSCTSRSVQKAARSHRPFGHLGLPVVSESDHSVRELRPFSGNAFHRGRSLCAGALWDSSLGMVFQTPRLVGPLRSPFLLQCPTALPRLDPPRASRCRGTPAPPAAASGRPRPAVTAHPGSLTEQPLQPSSYLCPLSSPHSPGSQFSGPRSREQTKMVSILIVLGSRRSLRLNPGPGAPCLPTERSLPRVRWEQAVCPLRLL